MQSINTLRVGICMWVCLVDIEHTCIVIFEDTHASLPYPHTFSPQQFIYLHFVFFEQILM